MPISPPPPPARSAFHGDQVGTVPVFRLLTFESRSKHSEIRLFTWTFVRKGGHCLWRLSTCEDGEDGIGQTLYLKAI